MFGGERFYPSRKGVHKHQQIFVAIESGFYLSKVHFPGGPWPLPTYSGTCTDSGSSSIDLSTGLTIVYDLL